MISQRF